MDSTCLIGGLGFSEGPRWHGGRLWFSDFGRRVVRAVDMVGGVTEVLEVPARPSGLGWLPDGSLLVVSMEDHRVLRLEGDQVREHADLSDFAAFPCNDMAVDARGNAYVGHMGFSLLDQPLRPKPASLLLVRPDGSAEEAAPDLLFPNGVVVSADGATLVVAETFGERLTAFDVAADGGLSGRRTFAELPGRAPDGICLDRTGSIWVADARGRACLRVREGGEVTDVISTGRGCYACALGGPDGRTLFLCLADGYHPRAMQKNSGSIEMIRVEHPG
ncbi:MAG: SMP-30/gluconolactonase/LRE family protein [Myxococcales bacterium]|nr:SMP-30/gluconolactonase/LRE family protein [Myxococcales bacterium]MDD9970492.1 SMP-30/gluconolactonase/LRE family protein [Myxococcales bacterium]